MDWAQIWNDIVTFFKTNAWNIVIFFAVLIFGILFIKILLNIIKRVLNKTHMEKITIGFLCVILKICLYLLLILILLSIIGIEITGVLTALSAIVLAIGLALENIIANAANGIVIISNKMFKKGDYIEVDGKEGNVVQINFLFTTILTSDNKRVTIPNSTIVNSSVVDYDSSKTRRVDIKFNVAYESDVNQVKKIILDCMKSNGKVLLNPEPFCRLNALNSSSIEFVAKCWCDSEDYWDVYYDVLELVYNELKRNKISLPYDQIEVRERKDKVVLPVAGSGIPKRVEKDRKKEEIDLENMSFSDIFSKKHGKKTKNKKKKNVDNVADENIDKDNSKNSADFKVDKVENKEKNKRSRTKTKQDVQSDVVEDENANPETKADSSNKKIKKDKK